MQPGISLRRRVFRYILSLMSLLLPHISSGQQVDVISSEILFQMIDNCDNTKNIKVYNFWATWCAPCIREIPHFENVNQYYSNVDVILVSLDDVDLLNKKVKPFIIRKEISSRVVLLNETDMNFLIDKVDKTWSGAIPATLIVDCKNKNRLFFEKEFKEDELSIVINKLVKHP